MASNMFLKLTNIDGESLDDEFEKQIEVEGWKWGLKNGASFRINESEATPHTKFDHLSIDKFFDHASLTLAKYCSHGKHIPEAILSCRKNTGEKASPHPLDSRQDTFLKIKLTNVKVESIDWPGGKGENGLFLETITLSFLEVDAVYEMQRQEGGLHAANHYSFNVANPDKSEGK